MLDFSLAFIVLAVTLFMAYKGQALLGWFAGSSAPTIKSNPTAFWALVIFQTLFIIGLMVIIIWFPDWIPRHQ